MDLLLARRLIDTPKVSRSEHEWNVCLLLSSLSDQILDLASLYGFSNPTIMSGLLTDLLHSQPRLLPEVSQAAIQVARVITQIDERIANEDQDKVLEDMLLYAVDIVASLSRLVTLVPGCINAFKSSAGELLRALSLLYDKTLGVIVEALSDDSTHTRQGNFIQACTLCIAEALVESLLVDVERGLDRESSWEELYNLLIELAEGGAGEGKMVRVYAAKYKLCERLLKIKGIDGVSIEYLGQLLQLQQPHPPSKPREDPTPLNGRCLPEHLRGTTHKRLLQNWTLVVALGTPLGVAASPPPPNSSGWFKM